MKCPSSLFTRCQARSCWGVSSRAGDSSSGWKGRGGRRAAATWINKKVPYKIGTSLPPSCRKNVTFHVESPLHPGFVDVHINPVLASGPPHTQRPAWRVQVQRPWGATASGRLLGPLGGGVLGRGWEHPEAPHITADFQESSISVLKALSKQDAKPRNHRRRGIALIIPTKKQSNPNLNTNDKRGKILATQDRERIFSLLKCCFKSVRKKPSTQTLSGQDTNMHTNRQQEKYTHDFKTFKIFNTAYEKCNYFPPGGQRQKANTIFTPWKQY